MCDFSERGGNPAVGGSAPENNFFSEKVNKLYSSSVYKSKPPAAVDGGDYISLAASYLISVLFIRCAVMGGFNFGFTLWYMIFFAAVTCFIRKKGIKPDGFTVFCGAASVVMSVPFSIWGYDSLKLFAFFATSVLCALYLGGLSRRICTSDGSYLLASDVFCIMFRNPFLGLPYTVSSFYGGAKNTSRNVIWIGAGLVISLPLVIIVTALLSKSDYAFEGLVSQISGKLFELIVSLILGLIITPFAYSAYFMLKKSEPVAESEKKSEKLYSVSSSLVCTVLVLLSIVYMVYLFSQTAYFFSGFSGLLPKDFTAAEYARRGFFEMSAVAGVNLCIVLAAYVLACRGTSGKPLPPVKALSVFISAFTLVLISTAFSKMYMYIVRFGFTPKRITTCAFMVFLFAVFAMVIVMQFKKIPYMKLFTVFAAVVLATVFWANPGYVSAKYNYELYKSGVLTEFDAYSVEEAGHEYLFKYMQNSDMLLSKRLELLKKIGCSYLYSDIFEQESQDAVTYGNDDFFARNIVSEKNRELAEKAFSTRTVR